MLPQASCSRAGEEITASVVLSNADPRHTLLNLVGRKDLRDDDREAAERFDVRGSMARIHLASREVPQYTAFGSQGVGPEHQGHQLLGASVPTSSRAGWPRTRASCRSSL